MDETISPKNKREQREVLIIMLRYLLDNQDSGSKDSDDNKSIAETEIEEKEIKLEKKESEDLTIKYFFDKESEQIGYRAQIDLYQRRVYDELHAFLDTDDCIVAEAENQEEVEYTAEEAKKTLEEVQYSSILGINLVDNYEEYRRLDQWIMFNPAIFALFQFIYNLNKDVDYRPPA